MNPKEGEQEMIELDTSTCTMCGREIEEGTSYWAPPDEKLGPAFHPFCAPPSQTDPDDGILVLYAS